MIIDGMPDENQIEFRTIIEDYMEKHNMQLFKVFEVVTGMLERAEHCKQWPYPKN